jgi:two-component system sensor histidine kinase TctE
MHKPSSLRWRLLWNLALLLVVLMLASGLSAYWNGREAADTAYDRTLAGLGADHRCGPVAT